MVRLFSGVSRTFLTCGLAKDSNISGKLFLSPGSRNRNIFQRGFSASLYAAGDPASVHTHIKLGNNQSTHDGIQFLSTFYREHRHIQNEMLLRSSYELELEYDKGVSVSHIGIWYDDKTSKTSDLHKKCFKQLESLCDTFGVACPPIDAKIFTTRLNPVLTARFEEHSEFCAFTFIKSADTSMIKKSKARRERAKPCTELSFGSPVDRDQKPTTDGTGVEALSGTVNAGLGVDTMRGLPRAAPTPVFVENAIDLIPLSWLNDFGKNVLISTHVEIVAEEQAKLYFDLDYETHVVCDDITSIRKLFNHNSLAGAQVAGQKARVYMDFRSHGDGFSRILMLNGGTNGELDGIQAGRVLQRLLDVENYRNMFLLGLPVTREVQPRLRNINRSIAETIKRVGGAITIDTSDDHGDISKTGGDIEDEALLHEVCNISNTTETLASSIKFRLNASLAYFQIINDRCLGLRFDRIEGIEQPDTLLRRHHKPVARTCESIVRRINDQAEQNLRAAMLLQARVNVRLQKQTQSAIESMEKRTVHQLKLQEAVEGLSTIVLAYYSTGLASYLLKAMHTAGYLAIQPEVAVGVFVPAAFLCIAFGIHRMKINIYK
mmetsp:Transcript_8279/g.9783  ORF Transcript_8279/g.9783 Transcript_8279/m.9783 type:complete len:604 (+) Transcript_8279:158-1969(+)|eukprot:CAMPEP_0204834046 /NCGR_PEP_ID=MMETSP1346-20131115/18527_1 /ASSEMBLY_ACC=CAM_ASM_000771 /TAXON_ID=215587 /ORGANISM="Aplanochytrium stocchinoi, Strain GSBS06" /LENGTH=603 /DNA_ID=CAMNT_0051967031 /DNA_START=57 /DNA_END=1868 /DNA_ORIENTATION=-